MQSKIRTSNGEAAFLELSGRIENGPDAVRLEQLLNAFITGEYGRLEVDLGPVAHIGPDAINILRNTQIIAQSYVVSVIVMNTTQEIRDALLDVAPSPARAAIAA